MGAVYSVTLKIKYNSEDAVINATQEFINANSGHAVFDEDYSSLLSTIQIILPERGFTLHEQTDNYLSCDCDFDASYGWESVMQDWFNSLVQSFAVQDGSTIMIYPDSGWETATAKNGTAYWRENEGGSWAVGPDGYPFQNQRTSQATVYEEQADAVPMQVDDPELQQAIDFLNAYGESEFEHICIDENTDLSDVGLMYTTAGDNGEHEVQASADLKNCTLKYYVDGNLEGQDDFGSLSEMIDLLSSTDVALVGIFDWLYGKCCDFIDWDSESEDY